MDATNTWPQRDKMQSITTKFAMAGGLLLALVIMIAATGYFTLTYVHKAQSSIHISTEIQRLVLEMNRGLEESRRLYGDFIMQYPAIGLSKAHEAYAQPSIRKVAQVIRNSGLLSKMIEKSPVSEALKKKQVDLNLFLSSAERFAETSITSVELVTKLAAPIWGIEPRLDQAMTRLYAKIAAIENLRDLHREMTYFILKYKLSRQRFVMQSAFNTAFKIREDIARITSFSETERDTIDEALDQCIHTAEEMLDVDSQIKAISNDFYLQDDAMKPVSQSLVALARDDVEKTRNKIDKAQRTALGIMLVITLLGLCLAMEIVWLLNKGITLKLVALTMVTSEFRKGNLNISAQEGSRDELGELARTFNAMASRIRDLVDHLEDKVDQRTLELETSNIELQREIQERIQAEEEKEDLELQLRQAHKMEAIGTLAGGVAHDFNNILAAIMGYSEMAMEDIPEWNPARYAIKEVLNASHRAKDLVKQILAYSRKTQQGRKPVSLNGLVEDALKMLRASIPTTIVIHQEMKGEHIVLADPTQIHQVIINLCTNGAQAMDSNGGTLTLGLCEVELDEDDLAQEKGLNPGSYAALSVKDQGEGIDQAIISRIFDPYFTTKAVGKGSGMGLSVVHGIVKSHEGLIRVESTKNKGTAFTVYLPRIETLIQNETEIPDPMPRGTEHILVVDDEAAMADIQRQRLEGLGYQVTTRTESQDALELFQTRKHDFHLVLTDQTMPRMTGEQMAAKMLAIRPDIPIILCTGFSSKIDEAIAFKMGIKAFLMKPIEKIILAQTIRKVLDDPDQAL
ncbi:MAG: response regulator [Proteobacteria bacterium]|nr:response regulator [Pseudomonadota bacterium]